MATCPLRSENRQTTGNAIDAFEKAALANAKQKETV
jgi:hypothetical protein